MDCGCPQSNLLVEWGLKIVKLGNEIIWGAFCDLSSQYRSYFLFFRGEGCYHPRGVLFHRLFVHCRVLVPLPPFYFEFVSLVYFFCNRPRVLAKCVLRRQWRRLGSGDEASSFSVLRDPSDACVSDEASSTVLTSLMI